MAENDAEQATERPDIGSAVSNLIATTRELVERTEVEDCMYLIDRSLIRMPLISFGTLNGHQINPLIHRALQAHLNYPISFNAEVNMNFSLGGGELLRHRAESTLLSPLPPYRNYTKVPHPPRLGDLMKKGGLSIDDIIEARRNLSMSIEEVLRANSLRRALSSVCHPRDHRAFADYLKTAFQWAGAEARVRWRACIDLGIDPRQLLQERYRGWRLTQKKAPLSRLVLCSASSQWTKSCPLAQW